MNLKEIKEKNTWESFFKEIREKTFLQSWNWGEFQKAMRNKIWRLGTYDNEELVACALITKIQAKRGKFLLIQHGPSFAKASEGNAHIRYEMLKNLLEELKRVGKEEKANFIRMNPLWELNQENQDILMNLRFKKAPIHANAYEATWKLDISLSEEEILQNMRKTTRYLIRQAVKNQDITIEKSEKLDGLGIYQNLSKEVAKRQKFVPFSDEYIKNEFEVFSKDNQALLFFGKYKGEIASAALVVFWSGIGFYHQAASLSKYAEFSIPYLLQWEAIKEAKKRGCNFYDFWGYIDPQKFPKHPWSGPTLFKMGFGGGAYEYVKTQDFILSQKYWFNWMIEKLRKIKRGL
ncbi:MAG: peptidoglycan bridge formation glycyltransferase FemA/FemB family protein [Candidatus Nealsonbacteria bacterium]|nr:peptidoglycan bridge formation glycyltransferase FemA/FemB family protein [Candidatus Nealsonbacteria bacterium]